MTLHFEMMQSTDDKWLDMAKKLAKFHGELGNR